MKKERIILFFFIWITILLSIYIYKNSLEESNKKEIFQNSNKKFKGNKYPVIGVVALPSQYKKLYNSSYNFIGDAVVNWIQVFYQLTLFNLISKEEQESFHYKCNQVKRL